MPNEGPYGGKIEIGEDGNIVWQAAGRSFPKAQDRTDTLDYAIRVITRGRDIFSSGDGKCIVQVRPRSDNSQKLAAVDCSEEGDPVTGGPAETDSSEAISAVLIVSGYEVPQEEERGVVVGKSYFITGAKRDKTGMRSNIMPPYDVHLTFDDYDLERAASASLQQGKKIDETMLSFCYQHWVSVWPIWRYYSEMQSVTSPLTDDQLRILRNRPDWGKKLSDLELIKVVAWSRVYRHLECLGVSPTAMDKLIVQWDYSKSDPAIWFSAWRPVVCLPEKNTVPSKEISRAFRPPLVAPLTEHSRATLLPQFSLRTIYDLVVKEPINAPIINTQDLYYYVNGDAENEGYYISGIFVPGRKVPYVRGSRTGIRRGIGQPGTFALMYHPKPDHDAEH